MNTNHEDKFAADLTDLAGRLQQCEQVTRYDTPEEKQAWTLAHNLLDLAESCRRFLEVQLPQLRDKARRPDETHDVLLDIGEELRHVLYHIRDSKFYEYLRDDVPAADARDSK